MTAHREYVAIFRKIPWDFSSGWYGLTETQMKESLVKAARGHRLTWWNMEDRHNCIDLRLKAQPSFSRKPEVTNSCRTDFIFCNEPRLSSVMQPSKQSTWYTRAARDSALISAVLCFYEPDINTYAAVLGVCVCKHYFLLTALMLKILSLASCWTLIPGLTEIMNGDQCGIFSLRVKRSFSDW